MSKKPAKPTTYPEFLKDLLEAKSPTGHEFAAQKVIDDHVEKSADKYSKDALGNRIAELKGDGGPTCRSTFRPGQVELPHVQKACQADHLP